MHFFFVILLLHLDKRILTRSIQLDISTCTRKSSLLHEYHNIWIKDVIKCVYLCNIINNNILGDLDNGQYFSFI